MKTCFVVSPIGEDGSATRKRSDLILNYVIKPAIEQIGLDVIRGDQISSAGLITNQVVSHLIEDDLVIADLSERNPNVYYEVAIRQAIRKPIVMILAKGEPVPFDLLGMRIIFVDHKDLEDVEKAKLEIKKQAQTELGKTPAEIDSPISAAIQLKALNESGSLEEKYIASIASEINSVSNSLGDLKTQISALQRRGAYITYEGASFANDLERLIELLDYDMRIATSNKDKTELLEHILQSLQALFRKASRSKHETDNEG